MAGFSVDDQPLLDLVHNIFTGTCAATFSDCNHLNPKMPCNAVATPHHCILSDHSFMEFTPHEQNGLSDNPTVAWPISQASNSIDNHIDVAGFFKDQNPGKQSSMELSSHEDILSKDAKTSSSFVVEPKNTHCLMDSKPPKLEALNSTPDEWIIERKCKGESHESKCVDKISNSSHKPCGCSSCTPYVTEVLLGDASHFHMTKRNNDVDVMDQKSGGEEPLKGLKEIKWKRSRSESSCKKPEIHCNGESKLPVGLVKAQSTKNYIHVRARRGEATDSHSLAERARRRKIRERMKKLEELVPGCSKVTGKAQMLDEIISYIQSLQSQVEVLSVKLAFVVRLFNFPIQIQQNSFLDAEAIQHPDPIVAHDDDNYDNVEHLQLIPKSRR